MSIKRISVLNLCHILKPFMKSTPGSYRYQCEKLLFLSKVSGSGDFLYYVCYRQSRQPWSNLWFSLTVWQCSSIDRRFNHEFEVFNVCCGPRGPRECIDIDRGPQQTLNNKNPWLNVIIIHFKLVLVHLDACFQQWFQYCLHLSRSVSSVLFTIVITSLGVWFGLISVLRPFNTF